MPLRTNSSHRAHGRQGEASAIVGVAAGLAGWVIMVLAAQAATGRLDAAVTASGLVLPYLAFAACCAAIVIVSTRIPRGAS